MIALLVGLGVLLLALSFVMVLVSAVRLLFWLTVALWPVVIALVLAVAFISGAHAQWLEQAPNGTWHPYHPAPAPREATDPLRAYCKSHTQAACGAYLQAIAQCPQRGAMAFVTLQSIQWWMSKGLSPAQAAQRIYDTTHDYDMTAEALAANQSPGRPSPDDFRKTVLAGCYAEAAQ